MNRRKDKIYLACMAMIALMYSCVAINAGINHVVELKDSDGRCYFGIRAVVAVPFVVVNFFTDAALTAVFVYLLRPVLQKQGGSAYSCMIVRRSGKADGPTHGGEDTPMRKNIRNLLWKSIIGSLLIEISSAGNIVQIIANKGDELGMICMTICLVDGKFANHTHGGPRCGLLTVYSLLGCPSDPLAALWLVRLCSRQRSDAIESNV